MALKTTTIGAYPKPHYVPNQGLVQFRFDDGSEATLSYNASSSDPIEVLDRGVREVVEAQVSAGIDIPTDGEVRRENYIHYHCRHLNGIDFERLTRRTLRNGAWEGDVPTFVGAISPRESFLPRDWEIAQSATHRPVKITMPGP